MYAGEPLDISTVFTFILFYLQWNVSLIRRNECCGVIPTTTGISTARRVKALEFAQAFFICTSTLPIRNTATNPGYQRPHVQFTTWPVQISTVWRRMMSLGIQMLELKTIATHTHQSERRAYRVLLTCTRQGMVIAVPKALQTTTRAESDENWPPNPTESGHGIRAKLATESDGICSSFDHTLAARSSLTQSSA